MDLAGCRTRRCRLMVLGLAVLGLFCAAAVLGVEHLRRRACVADEARRCAGAVGTLDLGQVVAHLMTVSRLPALALGAPAAESQAAVDVLRAGLGADAVYRLGGDGVVTLCCDHPTQDLFLGHDFAFRPYVRQALAGEAAVFAGLGVSTRERGIYVGVPAAGGALAVKLGLSRIDQLLAQPGPDRLLLTPEGVVLAASRDAWRFALTRPLTLDEQARIAASRQFPGLDLRPLPIAAGLLHAEAEVPLDGALAGWRMRVMDLRTPAWRAALLAGLAGSLAGAAVILLYAALHRRRLLQIQVAEARQALVDAGERLRQVLDLLNDPAALCGVDGRAIWVNDAFRRCFGHDGSRPGFAFTTAGEVSLADDQGVTRHFSCSLVPAGGGATALVLHDITRLRASTTALRQQAQDLEVRVHQRTRALEQEVRERQEAERALRASEERLERAQAIAQIGSFEVEVPGGGGFWSSGLLRLLGLDAAPAGAGLEGILAQVHPDDRRRVDEAHRACLDEGQALRCEFRLRRADGVERIIREEAARHPRPDGGWELRGVLHDVTEARALEDRLVQAEKLRSVGQLAGGVAHDVNNALAAILGCSELIADRVAGDPDALRLARTVAAACRRAAGLAARLLAFARKGRVPAVPVDVAAVVQEVASLLQATLDRRLRLCLALPALPAFALGDAGLLQSAILNLAVNARDAMPEGGDLDLALAVSRFEAGIATASGAVLPAGDYLVLTVRDAGCGMSEEVRARLFEPFFTTKEPGRGTGLGLPAVLAAARDFQGGVRVESVPGRGSCFELLLPALPSAGAAAHESRPQPSLGSGRILVVDDEADIRMILGGLLGGLGYTVAQAEDGLQAETLIEKEAFDLVLLDMVMPRRGGLETFRHLRARQPGLRVLVSSGYSRDGDVEQVLAEGAVGFLAKPFRRSELAQRVAEALAIGR